MQIHPQLLPEGGARILRLPRPLLLPITTREAGGIHTINIMARTALQHHWNRGQRLLLHQLKYDCNDTGYEREHGRRDILGLR